MTTSYYECNWENVILNSSDTKENVALLKVISMAIALNQKPLFLSGYKFFSVSLISVTSVSLD